MIGTLLGSTKDLQTYKNYTVFCHIETINIILYSRVSYGELSSDFSCYDLNFCITLLNAEYAFTKVKDHYIQQFLLKEILCLYDNFDHFLVVEIGKTDNYCLFSKKDYRQDWIGNTENRKGLQFGIRTSDGSIRVGQEN